MRGRVFKNSKLSLFFVLFIGTQACGRGGSHSPESGVNVPMRLSSGEDCYPRKINNKSEVVLACGDRQVAIWSEKNGIEELPPMPQVFSISPPNILLTFQILGFSDDGKVLLSVTAPFDFPSIEEIPVESYLYDGSSYLRLSGDFRAMSSNGEYLAGLVGDFQPTVLRNLTPMPVVSLPDQTYVIDVMAVNNSGVAIADAYYTDSLHAYLNRYAATFSKDESKILPPPSRPDRNSSSAIDINSAGKILIAFENEPSLDVRDSPIFRTSVLSKDGEIEDIYANSPKFVSTLSAGFNDSETAIFTYVDQADDVLIYRKGKSVTKLQELVKLKEGEVITSLISEINDQNEILMAVSPGIETSETEYRLVKIE